VHLLPLREPGRHQGRAAQAPARSAAVTLLLAGLAVLAVVLAVLNGYAKAYSP
jgi:hypothetical protein